MTHRLFRILFILIMLTLFLSACTGTQSQAGFKTTLVNAIGQKIQRATTVDDTLQTAICELGVALGASRVSVNVQVNRLNDNDHDANHN